MKKNIIFKLIIIIFLCLKNLIIYAQNADYWQQAVSYKIEVQLNDTLHELYGFEEITYTNHAPQELSFLYFHLWPNAYKNDETAFAKQQLENGSTRFYFSKQHERGYITDLDFKISPNNTPLKIEYDPQNIDIAKIILPTPLRTNQTITITTPFKVKIPHTFSRFGHDQQSYQITQWYPKPAVYDAEGWHPMPYLDQGEFYSEYGDFDVKIIVPQNYVVAATGNLQTPTEIDFLQNLAKTTQALLPIDTKSVSKTENSTPPTNYSTLKTLHYTQNNIHDFAWFADKRFLALNQAFQLPNTQKTVQGWAFFMPSELYWWQHAPQYIKDGISAYSQYLGEYPYQHATAVCGTLLAGGGMEYPTITIISPTHNHKQLETVIVHELGHNWFYGILGTNERQHPWLDEGLNSYYEQRYLAEKYPNANPAEMFLGEGKIANKVANKIGLANHPPDYFNYITYQTIARNHLNQPIELPANQYTSTNYGVMVYLKSQQAFKFLENYLTPKRLDTVMHRYYKQFAFKHPQPSDLKNAFEKNTPKNTEWFFDQLIKTNKPIDYKICKAKPNAKTIGETTFDQITLKNNHHNVRAPFSISALNAQKEIVKTVWYDGFLGEMDVLFPAGKYHAYKIDAQEVIPETNRKNNTLKTSGLLKKVEPCKLEYLGSLENPDRTQLFFMPLVGYNYYDKIMFGMAFYNTTLPIKNWQYLIAPMFATGNGGSFSGAGNITYNLFPSINAIKRIELKLAASTFGHGYFNTFDSEGNKKSEVIKYYKFNPEIKLRFNNANARNRTIKYLSLRHTNITKDQFDCPDGVNCSTINLHYKNDYINELAYTADNKRRINPLYFKAAIQQGKGFTLATTEFKYRFSYKGRKTNGLDIRLFTGNFFSNNTAQNAIKRLTISDIGSFDYMLDNIYFKRNGDGEEYKNDFLSRQIYENYGGFKIVSSVGNTDRSIAALNLKTSLFKKLPIKLYADAGSVISASSDTFFPWKGKFLFDAGIALTPFPNIFEIYFPLLHSSYYNNIFDVNNVKWYQKISFMIDLGKIDIQETLKEIGF